MTAVGCKSLNTRLPFAITRYGAHTCLQSPSECESADTGVTRLFNNVFKNILGKGISSVKTFGPHHMDVRGPRTKVLLLKNKF